MLQFGLTWLDILEMRTRTGMKLWFGRGFGLDLPFCPLMETHAGKAGKPRAAPRQIHKGAVCMREGGSWKLELSCPWCLEYNFQIFLSLAYHRRAARPWLTRCLIIKPKSWGSNHNVGEATSSHLPELALIKNIGNILFPLYWKIAFILLSAHFLYLLLLKEEKIYFYDWWDSIQGHSHSLLFEFLSESAPQAITCSLLMQWRIKQLPEPCLGLGGKFKSSEEEIRSLFGLWIPATFSRPAFAARKRVF